MSSTNHFLKQAQIIWKLGAGKSGFSSFMEQFVVTEATKSTIRAECVVTEAMANIGDAMHGGAAATIVDNASSVSLMVESNKPGVSVNLSMTYLKPAMVGETIIVESKNVKVGKTLAYLDVILKRKEDDVIIATGKHIKYIGENMPRMET